MDARIHLLIFLYLCKSISCYTFIDESRSYLKFRQWNATFNGSLSFRFKTYKKWGLLVYTDNSRSPSSVRNAVLIKLRRAKLYITVQMGDEDYKSKKNMEIGEELDDSQWHTVQLVRKGKETRVILDGTQQDYIHNDGIGDKLALDSGLYVGGLSEYIINERKDRLVDKSALRSSRFVGCIDSLKYLHSHEVENESRTGRPAIHRTPEERKGVKDGCLDACANERCENHGKCRNKFTKIHCDCKGTGYEGSRCTNASDAIQFGGHSYLTYEIGRKMENPRTTDISVRFRTKHGDGVIFAAQSHHDHLMLELHNTVIRLSIDLGGGGHVSTINDIPFDNGEWHLVEVTRTGRQTRVLVDKKYCVNSTTQRVHSQLVVLKSRLHVGGHPNKKLLERIQSKSKVNFTGCLQQVYFNGVGIVYKVLQVQSPLIKKYGEIKKGCDVVRKEVRNIRTHEGPKETVSRVVLPASRKEVPKKGSVEEHGERIDESSLSRQSYVWITVGLVIGSIILVITVGVIVHNVRYRYRAVLLSSSLKNLRDNNSLHRRFSSNDRMLRGSTDRMLHHGSSERFMRASTDRLLRGTSTERMTRTSTERMLRGSNDRIMRASTDRLPRGSVDRLIRSNSERRLRGSNDRMLRMSTDNERPLRTCGDNRSIRSSISRLERSQRGSSVHGSIHTINERMAVRDSRANYLNNNNNSSNTDNHIPTYSNFNHNNQKNSGSSNNNSGSSTSDRCHSIITATEEAMDASLCENESISDVKDHSSIPPPPYKL